ncbi:MAG: hypothetical protein V1743_04345 [Nanoarchaeota archaeon]
MRSKKEKNSSEDDEKEEKRMLFRKPIRADAKADLASRVKKEYGCVEKKTIVDQNDYLTFLLALEQEIIGNKLSKSLRTNQLAAYMLAGMIDNKLDHFILDRIFNRYAAGDSAFISRNFNLLALPHNSPLTRMMGESFLNFFDVLISYKYINLYDKQSSGKEESCFACGNDLSAGITIEHKNLPSIAQYIGMVCWENLFTDFQPAENTPEWKIVQSVYVQLAKIHAEVPYPKGELTPRERKRLEEIKESLFQFKEEDVEEAAAILKQAGKKDDEIARFRNMYVELGKVMQRVIDRKDPSIALGLLEEGHSYFNTLEIQELPHYILDIHKKMKNPLAKTSLAERLIYWDHLASSRTVRVEHFIGDLLEDLSYYDKNSFFDESEKKRYIMAMSAIKGKERTYLAQFQIRMIKPDWQETRKRLNQEYLQEQGFDLTKAIQQLDALRHARFLDTLNGKKDAEEDQQLSDHAFVKRYATRWTIGGTDLQKDAGQLQEHYLTLEPIERFRETVRRMKKLDTGTTALPEKTRRMITKVYEFSESPLIISIEGFESRKKHLREIKVINQFGMNVIERLDEHVRELERILGKEGLFTYKEVLDIHDPAHKERIARIQQRTGQVFIDQKFEGIPEPSIVMISEDFYAAERAGIRYYDPKKVERLSEILSNAMPLAEVIRKEQDLSSKLSSFKNLGIAHYQAIDNLRSLSHADCLLEQLESAEQEPENAKEVYLSAKLLEIIKDSYAQLAQFTELLKERDKHTIYEKSRGFYTEYKRKKVRVNIETVHAGRFDQELKYIGFTRYDKQFHSWIAEDVDLDSPAFQELQERLIAYNFKHEKDIRLIIKKYEK